MHRGSDRTQRTRVRSPTPLTKFEIQRNVEELSKAIEEKNRKLERDAKRLEKHYGLTVDPETGRKSPPRREQYMSPIRIDHSSPDRRYNISSPIRISSPTSYRSTSSPRYDFDRHRSQYVPSSPPRRSERSGPRYDRKSPSPRRHGRGSSQYDRTSISPYRYEQGGSQYERKSSSPRKNQRNKYQRDRKSPSPRRHGRTGSQSERRSRSPHRNERNLFQIDRTSPPTRRNVRVEIVEEPVRDNTQDYLNVEVYPAYDEPVRAAEMPRWPMHRSPSPQPAPAPVEQAPLYPSLWKNEENIQVDPMPVFPMDEPQEPVHVRESQPIIQTREEKVRVQMAMIAEQAERAAKKAREEARDFRRYTDKERKQEAAREGIRAYREKLLEAEKEEETKKRKIERDRRHEQQKKVDEEERKRKQAKRRREEEEENKAYAERRAIEKIGVIDERFLKYLTGAIGTLNCEASRVEERNRNGSLEYKAVCYASNIPKEFVCGLGLSTHKGTAYLKAITKYVDKLVDLGVINSTTRTMMTRVPKFPKFLAEFIEHLCDEIAIFGVQISVTKVIDMRLQFEEFAKERSSKFWSEPDIRQKLLEFVKNNMGVRLWSGLQKAPSFLQDDVIANASAIFGSDDRTRKRTEDLSKKSLPTPPLPQLTNGNPAVAAGTSEINKTNPFLISPSNAFVPLQPTPSTVPSIQRLAQPIPAPPPLMSIPMSLPNVYSPQLPLNPPIYQQPMFQPPMFQPSIPGFPSPLMAPPQPLICPPRQPPQPLFGFQPQRPEDDPDFMNEIYS